MVDKRFLFQTALVELSHDESVDLTDCLARICGVTGRGRGGVGAVSAGVFESVIVGRLLILSLASSAYVLEMRLDSRSKDLDWLKSLTRARGGGKEGSEMRKRGAGVSAAAS